MLAYCSVIVACGKKKEKGRKKFVQREVPFTS
jgi:hypothetical protein